MTGFRPVHCPIVTDGVGDCGTVDVAGTVVVNRVVPVDPVEGALVLGEVDDVLVLGDDVDVAPGCCAARCDPLLHADATASAAVTITTLVTQPCGRIRGV